MYTVLVPVDENADRAHAIAEEVTNIPASDTAVEAIVLHVIEEFQVADDSGGIIDSEDLKDDIEPPESVATTRDALESAGLSTSVRNEHGDPASEILNAASADGVDIIAMAGRKRSPTGKAVFGSVTQSIILNANSPILVVTE